jgi:hypothetical protein
MQEIYFLECLFARFHPKVIFAIGNSLGWSTLALTLINPGARVLAIDAGLDRLARDGIAFTNRIGAEEQLNVTAVAGTSPGDVARAVHDAAMPPIEFAFIDGYHSIEQVVLDFRAVHAIAAPGCIYLFHDVANFSLAPGIERIAAESGFRWLLLHGTASGMAIVYDPDLPPPLDDIAPFVAAPETLRVIENAAWNHRHRHLARWRRSLRKRLGRLPQPASLPEPSE